MDEAIKLLVELAEHGSTDRIRLTAAEAILHYGGVGQ